MSLFGKLMALLNVLAAAGFLALATLDFAKHQVWADAVVQHDLVIEGLPIDDQQPDREGHPKVHDIREEVLRQLFSRSGQPVVHTQKQEVERVRGQLQAKLDDPNNKESRGQRLCRILFNLVDTSAEREQLTERYIAGGGDKTDDLEKQLSDAFDRVLSPTIAIKQGGTTTERPWTEPEQRRLAIARLLFEVTDYLKDDEVAAAPAAANAAPPPLFSSKAYDRYLAVVGLWAASHEVDERAQALQRMAAEVRLSLSLDREAFARAHSLVLQQIEDLSDRCKQQAELIKGQGELIQQHKTLVAQRTAERDRLDAELKEAQTVTQKYLEDQAVMEDALNKSRTELRDAFSDNQKLERQIRALEKGR